MTKITKAYPTYLILLILCLGCSSKINVAGCYASNFVEMGFFGEHLHLHKDSTFDYRFAGDLINEVGHGKYYLQKDTLVLLIHKDKPGTVTENLTAGHLKDTIRFYYRNKRLFGINIITGKVVTHASGYSKRKKYFLFGSHYYQKRHYLRKHPCEIWK